MLDLIMRRGQAQAYGAQQSGNVWGNALAGIGQTLAGGLQQYGAAQEEKKQREGLAKRDAAWVSFVEGGEWQKDPQTALAGSLKLWGPEKGPAMAQGLLAFQGLSDKGDEADVKRVGMLLQSAENMPDAVMERFYPAMREKAAPTLARLGIPPESLPEAWTPEAAKDLRQSMRGLGMALRGEKPAGGGEGFTLNPGDTRYGADGKVIAAAPAAEKAPNLQHIETAEGIRTFNPQTGEMGPVIGRGKPNAAASDNEPLVAVMDPQTGKPVLRRRSAAEGLAPASNREQGRAVTSGDAGKIAELDTSLDDLKVLRSAVTGSKATGTAAKAGAMLPNFVTEATGAGADAKAKQAAIDRVKQVIGKALEGGVLRKEDESKYEKILPTISDVPSVVEAKLKGLEQAITLRRQRQIESLADAGYDTGNFEARPTGARPIPPGAQSGPVKVTSDAEWDALAPGTMFVGPDGKTRKK